MTTVSSTPQPIAAATTTPAPAKPEDKVNAGGGIQGIIGDALRAGSAGYAAATRQESVEADKVAIHPFETVATATGLLKNKTANVKYVNKATGLLHTIGGFAMLVLTSNVSSTLRSPGETAVDLASRVADAIDGKDTAQGWSLGWGVRAPEGEQASGQGTQGGIGAALAANGVK